MFPPPRAQDGGYAAEAAKVFTVFCTVKVLIVKEQFQLIFYSDIGKIDKMIKLFFAIQYFQ